MDALKNAWGWLARRAENLLALLLASLFLTFLIQIVFRYLLNLPLGWTVEYVSIAWLWGILFGYAFVAREADVIRLDVIYNLLPRSLRRACDVVTGLVCAGIFAWTLPKTVEFVQFMGVEKTAYMHIPFSLVFAIYIPFAVAVIIRCLITVWAGITGSGVTFDTEAAAGSHDYE